jgi:predicted DNA-binding ribbon-helix-helix protein
MLTRGRCLGAAPTAGLKLAGGRQDGNLSSAIRLFVFDYFRSRLTA